MVSIDDPRAAILHPASPKEGRTPPCEILTLEQPPTDQHGSVPCHANGLYKARALARSLADHLGREAYVLLGYRPNTRGFRSPTYYVSKIPAPKIVVDGLPSADLAGPPFSSPLLLESVPPVQARRATRTRAALLR
jgi:hypothetical protein